SICETLTKAVPEQRPSGRFIIPELPTPYSQIVHSALVGDVTLRVTLDEARTLLDPSFVPRTKVAPQENSLAASADSAPDSATGSAPDSVPHSASGERYHSAANDFANDSAN